jgi:hypothetical protein
VGNDYSVGILGDWGSGLYGAPVCAKSIAEGPDRYGLMLHLGDVYYAATHDEVEDRFLRFWPRLPGALNRALNGNHEMYTGGHSYFEDILPGFGQASSYFALENDNWVLVGLDTSYTADFGGHEGNIDDAQVTWLRKILAGAGDKKVVLFSHHQPFTLLEVNHGGNLLAKLGEFPDGRVFGGMGARALLRAVTSSIRGRFLRPVPGAPEASGRKALTGLPASPSFGSQWRRLAGTADIPAAWAYDKPNLYIPRGALCTARVMRVELR